MGKCLTNGCTGQISAVTFCAKIRTKVAIKNLLGEPGVRQALVMMSWIAVLLLAFPAVASAETEQEFNLCSAYVEKAVAGEQTDLGWPVFVKLTGIGTNSLGGFTEAKTGKMIRIVVGDREFSRSTIWVPIPSGELHGTFSSKEVATDWQRTLAGQLPAAPCGAGN